MDYMREINAFYDWVATNPVSDSARNLWHALMHTANRAGWCNEFAVPVSVIEAKTGMSRSAIYRARNILKENGRIIYKNRPGNQSSMYTIIPLCVYVAHTPEHNPEHTPEHKADTVRNTKRDHNKTKTKTKTKTNTYSDDAFVIALEKFAEFRKRIKAPLTDHALDLLKSELERLAPGDDTTKVNILNQSILRGWKGVFPLKVDNVAQIHVARNIDKL